MNTQSSLSLHKRREFYMKSHTTSQGTSKPIKYTLLYDEIKSRQRRRRRKTTRRARRTTRTGRMMMMMMMMMMRRRRRRRRRRTRRRIMMMRRMGRRRRRRSRRRSRRKRRKRNRRETERQTDRRKTFDQHRDREIVNLSSRPTGSAIFTSAAPSPRLTPPSLSYCSSS